jgi:hypothetical protein
MITSIKKLLEGWGQLIRAVENVLIDNVAATVPWLAPLVPAYMVHDSMINRLGFPLWMGWAGAAVVEFLGLAAVSTAFQFWDYNQGKNKSDNAAPVWIALITASFYMLVVLVVNVMLDQAETINKLAKALLSLLSVVAAVVLALRAQHARRLTDIDRRKIERKEARSESLGKLPKVSESFGKEFDWRRLTQREQENCRYMTAAEIKIAFPGISERTALNWHHKAGGNGHNTQP